ncbi:MAG: hypothetical protein IJ433_04795 [Ruminococcus sp.]|nr:hypothetical protein [Ruminococcus sp.]
MKKLFKPTILVVLIIMMLSTLTGCKELDSMRKVHAVWTEKGVYDSFTLNGVEYKKVLADNLPYVYQMSEEQIFVTEPDVPVLLAASNGITFSKSRDGNFICGYLYDDPTIEYALNHAFSASEYINSGTNYVLYCKADIYEDVLEIINNGIEYNNYAYLYYDYEDGMSTASYYYLTDEENEAINKIIKEAKPTDDFDMDDNYSNLYISTVSEDHYFTDSVEYEILFSNDDSKYVFTYYSAVEEEWLSYQVPEDMTDTFDKITEKERASLKATGIF